MDLLLGFVRFIFRVLYRLLYYELSWTYDLVSWLVSFGQWRAWQRAAFPFLRGRDVLDIAHGTGHALLDRQALGSPPRGVALSPDMGRITRRRLRALSLPVPLVRARVQNLPFALGRFPSLLSTFPADFILDPQAQAEFFRVLQPGGVLVCVPTAQFKDSPLADLWAAFLFRLRGLRNEGPEAWLSPFTDRFGAAGFNCRLERVALPRSVALVVVAEKPRGAPPR